MSQIIFERQVTLAEAKKGHITIRARYYGLFESQFAPIRHENDKSCPQADFFKNFIRATDDKPIRLKLCRRNAPRREMRLYFKDADGDGIRARNDQIVTITFTRKGPVIGLRPSGLKKPAELFPGDKEKSRAQKLKRPKDDEEKLNRALWTEPKQRTKSEQKIWARSGKLAETCVKGAAYHCEAGRDADSFNSKRTKKPYVEVHHLIPLKEQRHFRESLDCAENLCCLSPLAHRAIHYGTDDEALKVLEKLLDSKRAALLKFGINEDALYKFYGLE